MINQVTRLWGLFRLLWEEDEELVMKDKSVPNRIHYFATISLPPRLTTVTQWQRIRLQCMTHRFDP